MEYRVRYGVSVSHPYAHSYLYSQGTSGGSGNDVSQQRIVVQYEL